MAAEYPKWITAPNGKRCLTQNKEHEESCIADNRVETASEKRDRIRKEKETDLILKQAKLAKEKADADAYAILRAKQQEDLTEELKKLREKNQLEDEPPHARSTEE